jgi:hypothetical protein
VVHTPKKQLLLMKNEYDDQVNLMLPDKIAEMVVNLGLTDWLMSKIK